MDADGSWLRESVGSLMFSSEQGYCQPGLVQGMAHCDVNWKCKKHPEQIWKDISMTSAPSLDGSAVFCMFLLALQFGIQPTLTRRFTPKGICRSSVILMQELLKLILAYSMLTLSGARKSAFNGRARYFSGLRRWRLLSRAKLLQICRLDSFDLGGGGLSSCCLVCSTEYGSTPGVPISRFSNFQRSQPDQNIVCSPLLLFGNGS